MGDYLQLSTNYPLGEAAATIFAFQKSGRPRLIRLFYHHPGFRKQPGAAKRRQWLIFYFFRVLSVNGGYHSFMFPFVFPFVSPAGPCRSADSSTSDAIPSSREVICNATDKPANTW